MTHFENIYRQINTTKLEECPDLDTYLITMIKLFNQVEATNHEENTRFAKRTIMLRVRQAVPPQYHYILNKGEEDT